MKKENSQDPKQMLSAAQKLDRVFWAVQNKIKFGGQQYRIEGHEYQVEPLNSNARVEVWKTAAQMMKTTVMMLHCTHNMIHDNYPQGAMYIFPTDKTIQRFSQGRFTPFINDNPVLAQHITSTDNIHLKRVHNSNLYFVSGRKSHKIENVKKSSANLKEAPADAEYIDELDEMDPAMILLAEARLGHSSVKLMRKSSTPSIPDFGIDKEYKDSNQCIWMIRCQHCNAETCLETEFPEFIHEDKTGRYYRACKKCGKEIYPDDGLWVAQYPNKDIIGRSISQLNSAFVDPGSILTAFLNPPNGDIAEVYNSMLGMAYIATENRLTANDLWAITGQYPMPLKHPGPTAMGVDVGNDFHIVILDRPYETGVRLVKACHVSSKNMTDFSPLYDLIKQYNVKSCVIDFAPVQQKVRAFREWVSGCEVFGNIYQEHQRGVVNWDSKEGIVRENRTEVCDATHEIVVNPGKFQLPRRSDAINEYIKQMCNIAKVLEEDSETGSREYRYRKLGADHYRHATNYAFLAAARIGVFVPPEAKKRGDAYATGESESGSFMSA